MHSSLLPQTVEVFARSGQVDRFGQPVDANPGKNTMVTANVVGSWPCRAYKKSGGYVNEERSIDVYERTHKLHTSLDADIKDDDAVRVLHSDGTVLVPLARIKDSDIVYAGLKPHHKEFTIVAQTGPHPGRSS